MLTNHQNKSMSSDNSFACHLTIFEGVPDGASIATVCPCKSSVIYFRYLFELKKFIVKKSFTLTVDFELLFRRDWASRLTFTVPDGLRILHTCTLEAFAPQRCLWNFFLFFWYKVATVHIMAKHLALFFCPALTGNSRCISLRVNKHVSSTGLRIHFQCHLPPV